MNLLRFEIERRELPHAVAIVFASPWQGTRANLLRQAGDVFLAQEFEQLAIAGHHARQNCLATGRGQAGMLGRGNRLGKFLERFIEQALPGSSTMCG